MNPQRLSNALAEIIEDNPALREWLDQHPYVERGRAA